MTLNCDKCRAPLPLDLSAKVLQVTCPLCDSRTMAPRRLAMLGALFRITRSLRLYWIGVALFFVATISMSPNATVKQVIGADGIPLLRPDRHPLTELDQWSYI